MNLYIFNQTRRGAVYGVGTYIRELTVALKNSNIKICVVNLTSDKPQIQTEEIEGILHWHFPSVISDQRTTDDKKQWELYFHNVVCLLRLHIKDKKDLVFHLNYQQSGSLAEELKNAFTCKIVAVAHFCGWSFTVFDNPERLRRILNEDHPDSFGENVKKSFEEEKVYYSKVDRVICLSEYMQEILCQDYGLDAAKISVIPNGIADQGFQEIAGQARNDKASQGIAGQACNDKASQDIADQVRNDKDVKNLRAKWNISAREKIILFAGRLDEVKGVSYLIKAFREALEKFPNCRLIIAGSGNYDIYLQEAKEISAKITFTGLLEKENLFEIYQIADVGVVPSLFEPFGYVAVEMMMHELPLVATATSGLNEVVDESCGLKVPITVLPDNVEIDTSVLAEKIVYLLKNPATSKRLGRNGRKRYLKEYTSEVFRKNMLQVYQSMCREDNKVKTLIVTGQNSHRWEVSHIAIKQVLENSGLFTVDVAVSPKEGKIMSNFKPDFSSYQLVILDYCGDRWPEETEKSFLNFVEKGGGVVVYHAANNAFRHWKEYNRIIGFGGWIFPTFGLFMKQKISLHSAMWIGSIQSRATPDHTHAIIAATAMTLNKQVYVQKPLTHSVYESRLLTKLAAKYNLATQMGNQGSSDEGVDLICEWIWNGEIGEIRKVECATNRPMWPQGQETPYREHKIPSTLDWDLFVGPAKMRPYNSVYHPWNWRGWWDFGTGAYRFCSAGRAREICLSGSRKYA